MTNAECSSPLLKHEHKELDRILKFGLPTFFRPLGIIVAALIMTFLIMSKFVGPTLTAEHKEILKYLILLGGLVAMLAKDKYIDERSQQIRGQAFTVSFIFTAVQGMFLPVADYVVSRIKQDPDVQFADGDAFVILFSMFFTYLLYSYILKRFF